MLALRGGALWKHQQPAEKVSLMNDEKIQLNQKEIRYIYRLIVALWIFQERK
jgi:hypothetical protein